MELEERIGGVLEDAGLQGPYLKTATENCMMAIRDCVGATQEKLLNDLNNERAIRIAAERKAQALYETVGTLMTATTPAESVDDPSSTQ